MKFNKYYQYVLILIAAICLIFGIYENDGMLLSLGGIVLVGAVATLIHIKSGKQHPSSKLPKDIKIDCWQ